MTRPAWWQRARDGTWRRWSHRKADWEPAAGPPPEGAPVTGLLPEPPWDPPPAPARTYTRNQFVLWCLLVAGAILFGSLGALWLLSHVWDPFDMRGRGVWEGYRRAFIWVAALTAVGQTIAVIVARGRRGESPAPSALEPGSLVASEAPREGEHAPGASPVEARRTAAEWLADPPQPDPSDLQTPGEWLRGLARFLAVGCAVIAVLCLAIALLLAGDEPSEILGTDPQGAARIGVLLAGGFAIAAAALWWLGRKRRYP